MAESTDATTTKNPSSREEAHKRVYQNLLQQTIWYHCTFPIHRPKNAKINRSRKHPCSISPEKKKKNKKQDLAYLEVDMAEFRKTTGCFDEEHNSKPKRKEKNESVVKQDAENIPIGTIRSFSSSGRSIKTEIQKQK